MVKNPACNLVVSMHLMASRLAVCLLNISEARRLNVVDRIAKAAGISGIHSTQESKTKFKCLSTVLNIFSDHDYNRSVLTIAAPIDNLQMSVVNACKVANEEINLQDHSGGHPRLGSVDLIPIYPISPLVTLRECGDIARGVGNQIASEVLGTSMFFFGTADYPNTRGLVERRKEVGWYKGRRGMSYDGVKFDIGELPTSRYGLTGVGASPYVMNCNVTIETNNLGVGQKIAKTIRGACPGGLRGVQAMAFDHEGSVEIACNVEAFVPDQVQSNDKTKQRVFNYTRPNEIKERIKTLAPELGIAVKGTVIVGFTPDEVYEMAYKALSDGNTMPWENNQRHRM